LLQAIAPHRLRGIKPPMSGCLMIESKQHQRGYLQQTEVLLQAIAPHRLRGIKAPMSGCLMIEREEKDQACCWGQQATPERLPTANGGFAAINSITYLPPMSGCFMIEREEIASLLLESASSTREATYSKRRFCCKQ
jgi:hypothetical protein